MKFTNVVDRTVAQTACIAINKAIKRNDKNKKFIAISCHYDILDWLSPDWVFNTNDMKFDFTNARSRKEKRFEARECGRDKWKIFSKYHYLNKKEINKSSVCFGLYEQEKIIGFCSVLHQANPLNTKIKRYSRFVIAYSCSF